MQVPTTDSPAVSAARIAVTKAAFAHDAALQAAHDTGIVLNRAQAALIDALAKDATAAAKAAQAKAASEKLGAPPIKGAK